MYAHVTQVTLTNRFTLRIGSETQTCGRMDKADVWRAVLAWLAADAQPLATLCMRNTSGLPAHSWDKVSINWLNSVY